MGRLLHIIASSRGAKSNTLQVSRVFLESFLQKHPDWILDELNLSEEDLPDLSKKTVDGKYVLLQGKALFGELKESWEEILQQIERFLAADMYLISSPMWNFSIPYTLKQYIDLIVQPKYLFAYTESGVEGLVKNKRMVVICSRGGQYVSAQMKGYDFQEPYLREIFGFIGIKDMTFIKVEPMDHGEELRKRKIEEAQIFVKKLALEM